MESLADTGLATMKRFKLLQEAELESVEDQSNDWPKRLFLAQFDRFELWAVNLGVFVMGHGSLDYRIRDSESMKEAIHKMMNNLNRSLDEVLAYLHGNVEQEDEDSDTDSSSEMESDMDLLLDSIKDPIDRLYKMAVWIRNPATRIPSTKARNLQQVDEETNVDLFKSFENFEYDYVSSLFLEYAKNKALQENPTAQPHDAVGNYEAIVEDQVWEPIRKTLELNRMKISNGDESYLIHRIARANVLRRQQFAYWRKHKNKLREHATVTVEVPTHNIPTTSQTTQLEDKNEKFKVPLSVTTATQLRLLHKTGKELEKENAMTLAVSEYAPSAWNPSKDVVSFPLPPKTSPTDEFFECPYCYTICPASILSEKAWRAHLIRDLRPYICTFEQCLNSGQLYDSRDDWIQHETSTHQNVFRCPKHEEETFATLATYEEHTQMYHKEDAISPSFATSAATNIHRSCPICSIVLGTVQKLRNHIALHLERFAMFSLPRCTDDDNEGGSGGRSASTHVDSTRSFNEDLDIESNAAGKDEDISATNYAIIEKIRLYSGDVAMLRSPTRMKSEKDDEYFIEIMTQARGQLERYGEIIRAWAPNDTVNNLLFEFGEACIGSGLVEEAIKTFERLLIIEGDQFEHDEPALLRTKQQLTSAYQVEEALKEMRELFRRDPDIYKKPISTKVLHIFGRSEAGNRHAELIWGPSKWKTRQSQKELEHEDDLDSLSQGPTLSRRESSVDTFDRHPLPMAFNKQEELPPLAQNEDIHREEVYAQDQAQAQAQDQAQVPQQAHGNSDYELEIQTIAGFKYNRLMAMEAAQLGGLENIPQDVREKFWQQSYEEAQESRKDSVQQKPQQQQQQQTISEESNYNVPYVRQGHESPEDIPLSDRKRFNEPMEHLFEDTDANENHILSEDDQLQRGVIANSRSESTGVEGEVKRDLLDEKVQGWISEAGKPQYQQPQNTPSIARDVRSDVHEDIDLAGHSSQEPSRADHDRRVHIDPLLLDGFASEGYFEKLRQLQAEHQQANDTESNVTTTASASRPILPLRDSTKPTDEKPNPSVREKEGFPSMRQKVAADAGDDLNAVNAIAEQEMIDDQPLPMEENYEMREQRELMESELMILREFYRYLEEESLAEIEKAGGDTQLKLEAQTLAQTLAQRIALHKSSVEELKGQFARASRVLERNEKGHALVNKIRSFRFGELRDMITEIQNKREAREAQRTQTPRERTETQAQSEEQLMLLIQEANIDLNDQKGGEGIDTPTRHETWNWERKTEKALETERLILRILEADNELKYHEGIKRRIIERHDKALGAIHADRGQEEEDFSTAPGELEARDSSTEVPVRIETSESELNSYRESISAEEEKIREILEKIKALGEELRLTRAQREVQVPSGSENQETKSRGGIITAWKCCHCGMSGLLWDTIYQCTEHNCQHARCHDCTVYQDRVGPA